MDGAMPKTVLISLAAVVALIVIVILLGIRYLRADDDDDFDEDVAAEHGRYPRERARARREHDDMPHDRFRQRQPAAPAGRAPAARPAGRPSSRAADDRGWREEGGHSAGRGLPQQRDSRQGRSGARRDRDDISEPAAASARGGYQDWDQDHAGARGTEDLDAWPGRSQSAARDYERDRSEGRDDRDRFQARDGRDRRDARTGAGSRETALADRDDRDRRSASQSSHRPDGSRQNGVGNDQHELLPAIKPRQSRNKRDTDGDWPSNEWDELSDVDYWAELAADKPLTAPTPAEQAGRPRRGGSRSDASEPALRDGDAGRAGRQPSQRDAALQPDRAIVSTAARKLDPGSADRSEDLLGSGTRRASHARTEQLHALPPSPGMGMDGLQPRNPVRPDDDPLTSPSFPRIAADDSRSYRRSKRAAGDESEPGGRAHDGSTQPHSYPHPTGLPTDNGTGYPRAGASAAYVGPDADRYASVPNNGTAPGYPAAQGGYPVHGGGSSGSYPGGGYPAPADFGQNGYHSVGGSAPAGSYLPPGAAGAGGYSGDTIARGNYQPPAPDPASFTSPAADSGNYHSSPVSYPDAGGGGHLPAAAAGGYPISGDVTGFHTDHADFASAYPSYGDPRPSAFPQPRPDPGYLPNGYGAGHDPGFHSSVPGHLDAEYSAYQPPVAAVNASPYPPAGGQLPSPSAGYQDPYQAAPYDQAGYPSPDAQRGYAGGDPYAADPYGYSGYGNGGR
jgi:hypothetical protein